MFDLSGRVALVTGAGQSVGRGIALALASCGAAVAVNDIVGSRAESVAGEIVARGGRAASFPYDVTDGDAVLRAVQRSESTLGPIDILVSNAGNAGAVPMQQRPFRKMTRADWDGFLAVNLYGVLHGCRAVLDGMCERRWGRIITISSEAGRVGLGIGVSLYGAAKAAASSFMRHLSFEVAPSGVTCNTVSLGLMNNVPPEFSEPIRQQHPTGRLGMPEDIGAAVVYLASDEASWVTGQTLPVNGGIHAF